MIYKGELADAACAYSFMVTNSNRWLRNWKSTILLFPLDQVTWDREVGALQKASKFLNADKCLIVTYDQESVIPCKGTDLQIQVVPIYKYLLFDR